VRTPADIDVDVTWGKVVTLFRPRRALALVLSLSMLFGPLVPLAHAQAPPNPAANPAANPGPAPADPAQKPDAAPAKGQPNADEMRIAQQHYENGAQFFTAGNYPSARAEFEAAYQLTHLPDLLFNLAQVAQKQGRTADEERYLTEYLGYNPKDSADVRKRLDQIKSERPAEVQRLHPAAIGLVAGGAAALIIGIACGGAAISAASSVADSMNSGKPFTAELFATQERGKQLNSAAIAFDVIGAAALIGGGAWIGYWLYQRQKAKKGAPSPGASAFLRPSGLGIALTGSF
jgi:tetratricopeptide (TPR) repeat protein